MPERFRFRRGIVFRITGVFLLLMILTTLVVILAVRYYVRRDLRMGLRQELIKSMERMEADLYQVRSEVSLFAQVLARSYTISGEAGRLGEAAVQISLVEQARERGIEIARYTTGDPAIGTMGYLERGLAGISTVDYVIEGKGPDRIHLVGVAPLGGLSGERGVATASIAMGREYLRRKRAALGGDITLMTKGEMIVSSSTCLECIDCVKGILFDARNWEVLESGKTIYFSFDCRPEAQAGVATPIRAFDGRTFAVIIFRSMAKENHALYLTTLGITGGGAAFAVVLGWAFFLLATRAIRPLSDLTRLSAEISEGRYGETVPVSGEGEVAELGRSFNRMSVSLKDAMKEISDWNRLLETRVEEKTRELEEIHRRMVEVEKMAAMGQLAAGVAHELNNPLSGIMGYSEIALDQFKDRPPENVTPAETARMIGYFGNIESLSQRCRTIILDMLKFARQHTEEKKDTDLNEVIRQTLVFMEKQLIHGRVQVDASLAGGIPSIKANALQLQQVFTNLALNAVQAMPGGGTLTVRTRRQDGVIVVEFTDTGTGIARENLHRIFEPFFTTKPVGEGTGLGLSVSYGIVKHHGGDIRVKSDPGAGSTFVVVLPLPGKA